MDNLYVGAEPPMSEVPTRIGLIAGEGNFPVQIARAAKSRGVEIVTFRIDGLENDHFRPYSIESYVLKLSQLSKLIEYARHHNIKHVIMAGGVPHKVVLKQIAFEPRILSVLGSLANKKADTLLSAAVGELEKEGIRVINSTMFLRSCMPEPGLLTTRLKPSDEIMRDIEFGYPIARAIGGLDIGQSIAVRNGVVVAVEALEGTDGLIERAGALADEGCVIVKVAKPNQDKRFDVPVVGMTTIQNLVKIRAAALCLTAHESLFFDRQEAIALAEANNICIFARGNEDSVFNYLNLRES
ncbi:UDP-2,3-diacylglucosamine diphosphatase LpxI [Candidatus Sumerlaeota bacterium]|nr:UDP-2,3-diacylglucosamine diphosphatase LpxI [Candidatus Sumerlaeota bacterium]